MKWFTNPLIGNDALPNTIFGNPYLKLNAAINIKHLENQKVFPLHATRMNRCYEQGGLDENKRPVNFRAACGPLT